MDEEIRKKIADFLRWLSLMLFTLAAVSATALIWAVAYVLTHRDPH